MDTLAEIQNGTLKRVYEDDKTYVVMAPEPFVPGHLWIIPKKLYVILEQIPDDEVHHYFLLANKLSISLFESLRAQGTNILVQNGAPAGQTRNHTIIHLIPRFQGDGLEFTWQPKQLTEEQMSTIELRIKQFTKTTGIIQKEKKPEEKKEPEVAKGEENYYVKQLRRIA